MFMYERKKTKLLEQEKEFLEQQKQFTDGLEN